MSKGGHQLSCLCTNSWFTEVKNIYYNPNFGNVSESITNFQCSQCKRVYSISDMRSIGENKYGITTNKV